MTTPRPRVLLVDDDQTLLIGLSRSLRDAYELELAPGPMEGLECLEHKQFDVILSDMRMPAMNGAEFLKLARVRQPDAIRMILSGQSDLEMAAEAINEGHIFRFLLKPASREVLRRAVDAAVTQKRLLENERELLDRTLTGSIDALSETLALVSPEGFGRARRLKRIVSMLAAELNLENRWQLEIAASLSQFGAVTLPPATAHRWLCGETLSDVEKAMVIKSGSVPRQLLAHIPRLEPVIALLDRLAAGETDTRPTSIEEATLLVAVAVERRLSEGKAVDAVVLELESTMRGSTVVEAFKRLAHLLVGRRSNRQVTIAQLRAGMVLADDVKTSAGALLIARGHEVSESMMMRLRNFASTVGVTEPLLVAVAEEPVLA